MACGAGVVKQLLQCKFTDRKEFYAAPDKMLEQDDPQYHLLRSYKNFVLDEEKRQVIFASASLLLRSELQGC